VVSAERLHWNLHATMVSGILARRKELLEDIALEVESAGGRALCLPADVTDFNSLKSAASQVYAAWGHIDTLIANAVSVQPALRSVRRSLHA